MFIRKYALTTLKLKHTELIPYCTYIETTREETKLRYLKLRCWRRRYILSVSTSIRNWVLHYSTRTTVHLHHITSNYEVTATLSASRTSTNKLGKFDPREPDRVSRTCTFAKLKQNQKLHLQMKSKTKKCIGWANKKHHITISICTLLTRRWIKF